MKHKFEHDGWGRYYCAYCGRSEKNTSYEDNTCQPRHWPFPLNGAPTPWTDKQIRDDKAQQIRNAPDALL